MAQWGEEATSVDLVDHLDELGKIPDKLELPAEPVQLDGLHHCPDNSDPVPWIRP